MQTIDEKLTQSLSGEDIIDFMDKNGMKVNMFTYPELAKFNDLEEMFPNNCNHTVILYLTSKNYGHWCCLFKNKATVQIMETDKNSTNSMPIVKEERVEDRINFFDSYGGQPDSQLNWDIPDYVRTYADEDYPHLTWLLYNSKDSDKVHYNEYCFQQHLPFISTCGRHVITRLLLDKFTSQQYKKFIDLTCDSLAIESKKPITPDELVVYLTESI